MNTTTPAQALADVMDNLRKNVQPEHFPSVAAIEKAVGQLGLEIERWKALNGQNAEELDAIRTLTRPLFKNVDPMPGDCMIGVNRSVTVYGYVRDVVKQLENERQHGQHFAGLEERCREFEEIAALRKEAYRLVHEACGEFKAKAEAAEARCAELEQELAAAREAMAKKDSMLGEAPCRGLNADGNLRCLTTANLAKCAERVATTLEMPTLVKQSRSNPNAGFIDWRDWQALKSEVFDLRAALATLQRDRQP